MWLNHHDLTLFPILYPEKTTIINQVNWIYDNDIDAEGTDEGHNVEHNNKRRVQRKSLKVKPAMPLGM